MPSVAAGVVWAIVLIACLKPLRSLYRYIVLRRKLMKVQTDPYHWLWGHTKNFPDQGEGLVKYSQMLSAKFKSEPYRVMLGPFLISCVVSHPDDIQTVLKSSERKTEVVYGLLRPWLGLTVSFPPACLPANFQAIIKIFAYLGPSLPPPSIFLKHTKRTLREKGSLLMYMYGKNVDSGSERKTLVMTCAG